MCDKQGGEQFQQIARRDYPFRTPRATRQYGFFISGPYRGVFPNKTNKTTLTGANGGNGAKNLYCPGFLLFKSGGGRVAELDFHHANSYGVNIYGRRDGDIDFNPGLRPRANA